MWLKIILSFVVVMLLKYIFLTKDKRKHLGFYAQPGRWFYIKKYIFLVLLYLRKRRGQQSKETSTSQRRQAAGHGVKSYDTAEEMERPQPIQDHPHSMDCVYLGGFDVDGTTVVLRLGRRHQRKVEFWMILNIPGLGLLQSTLYPSTIVNNTEQEESFTANGLKMECLKPMKKWRFSFNGQLRDVSENEWKDAKYTGKEKRVTFSFIWEAFTPHFDFDTDMNPGMLADAVAREYWTRKFWDTPRSGHQTHYEQWGNLKGSIQLEGQEEKNLHLRAMRDHSYGMRDWQKFHWYITHLIYLEDGTVCHVTGVCMPDTLSFLRCGYMVLPDRKVYALDGTNLDISSVGENKNLPDHYSFTISAGGKPYQIEVKCHATVRWFNMEDRATETYERLMYYTCNGIKGSGIAEFTYRRTN